MANCSLKGCCEFIFPLQFHLFCCSEHKLLQLVASKNSKVYNSSHAGMEHCKLGFGCSYHVSTEKVALIVIIGWGKLHGRLKLLWGHFRHCVSMNLKHHVNWPSAFSTLFACLSDNGGKLVLGETNLCTGGHSPCEKQGLRDSQDERQPLHFQPKFLHCDCKVLVYSSRKPPTNRQFVECWGRQLNSSSLLV